PVKGEVYRPFEVLPPATVNVSDKVYVFSDATPKPIQFIIKANANNVIGTLQVLVPTGWVLDLKNPEFKLSNKGDEAIIEAMISAGSNHSEGKLQASLKINNTTYTKSIKRIEYDHIPYQFILSDAEAKLVNVNLKKAGTNIGYIQGAGDDVPACLKQVGYNVTMLTDDLLTNEDLSKYNAIVTGVRAYNTNDRLQVHYNKLMEYVKNGGNLVVQYNTNNRIGPVQAKIGPYPFMISRDRVTDEKAEARFVKPAHAALTFPNVITANDFDNWIQERGIYFTSEMDGYETVIAMNDPGEKSNEGSLIIGKYGKGNFVYTGLVFFRELPAGVPGAYRLFVNLISLPQNK
ncbi:MAG: LmbE family protein, partial [Bacteroidia bacterium]